MENPQNETLRRIRVTSAFVSGLLLIGCHYWPQQTNEQPAPPCPNPNIDVTRWPAIATPECGVILKLPKGYMDRGSNQYSDWFQHSYGNHFDSVNVFFTREEDLTLQKNRATAPDNYEGYSTCSETIGGTLAVITSYRDSATIHGKTRRFRPYVTEARWQLRPNEFVRVEASSETRRSQEEVLAALRSVQFIPRSWPLPTKQSAAAALIDYLRLIGSFPIQLTAYALVIACGGYLVFRRKARAIPIINRRRRAFLALYFALILTPSVLTDFFLFSAPAPALLAFFVLVPSFFYVDVWHATYPVIMLYILPILISFIILYFGLTIYARIRSKRSSALAR